MAAPAEVSKKCSNFRIRELKKTFHFNIAANLTLNMIVSFIILLITRTARIACPDRKTHTRDSYCNLRCACMPRVKYKDENTKCSTRELHHILAYQCAKIIPVITVNL